VAVLHTPTSPPPADQGAAADVSPLKGDAIDDFMASAGSIDTSLFHGEVHVICDEDAIAEATVMVYHRNLSAAKCMCVACSKEADVMVGSVAFCSGCSQHYHPQRPLKKMIHKCPDCGARIVTGTLLCDARTLFSTCKDASDALHHDAIEAHQNVCTDRPLELCEGVTASNMHLHKCTNPFCPLSDENLAKLSR